MTNWRTAYQTIRQIPRLPIEPHSNIFIMCFVTLVCVTFIPEFGEPINNRAS